MEYSYHLNSSITALGDVNLRENHIKFINEKWANQRKIGVVCKDQVINVVTLKRVARIADTSNEYDAKEFDGYWWAKVSGSIGSTCE